MTYFIYFVIAIVVIIFLSAAIKIVQEYERGGVFRLGRFVGLRGPGLVLIIPFIERMRKVDLRVITMDRPAGNHHGRSPARVHHHGQCYCQG
jgi:regulator of protease activity HflC (stomatin/prohibitin superfamily)